MVICRGYGMPEGLPQSQEAHGALGRDPMTVGGRQNHLLSGETSGAQADLTWRSLESNAASNLNPRGHSVPHTSPTAICLKHSSEPVPPCSHLTEEGPSSSPQLSRLAGLGAQSTWVSFLNASIIPPVTPHYLDSPLECPPPYCLGNSNGASSVRSSPMSPLLMR